VEATVKHRIVGSVMLLSLAAIILPFWLDGAGLEQYQSTHQQPPIPEVEVIHVIESLGVGNALETVDPSSLQVIELSPIIAVEESTTNTQNTNMTKLTSSDSLLNPQGLPNGWVVQLGNFGKRSNAARLKDKVIKAGFAAYMVPNGALFKVLVGPELDRPKAEALQEKLKNKFKMTGMVTLYQVEKL